MELGELKKLCQKQIEITLFPDPRVALKRPGRWGKRSYRSLFGVRGEIVCEDKEGLTVLYPAKRLLAAVKRQT